MTGPGPLDLLIIAFVSVGFVVVMGLIALAVEPYFAERRERIRRGWRNWRALRGRYKPVSLGFVPRGERNRVIR